MSHDGGIGSPAADRKCVLISGSSDTILKLLQDLVERHGFGVRSAGSEQELIDLIEAEIPALILLNIDRFIDGADVLLPRLAAKFPTVHAPIVAFSEQWREREVLLESPAEIEETLWTPLSVDRIEEMLARRLPVDGHDGPERQKRPHSGAASGPKSATSDSAAPCSPDE